MSSKFHDSVGNRDEISNKTLWERDFSHGICSIFFSRSSNAANKSYKKEGLGMNCATKYKTKSRALCQFGDLKCALVQFCSWSLSRLSARKTHYRWPDAIRVFGGWGRDTAETADCVWSIRRIHLTCNRNAVIIGALECSRSHLPYCGRSSHNCIMDRLDHLLFFYIYELGRTITTSLLYIESSSALLFVRFELYPTSEEIMRWMFIVLSIYIFIKSYTPLILFFHPSH